MFGLFGKKTPKLNITEADKNWVEENIVWFIEIFGFDKLKAQPFILPAADIFPYDDLSDDSQFQRIFEQVCKYWDIDPNEIIVRFFDDLQSKQWISFVQHGQRNSAAGLFNQIYTTDEKRFKVELAKSNLKNPQLLVTVLAHELAHVKLLGGNYLDAAHQNMEELTDLATIFAGFGIFMANSCQTRDINWISRTGYLPNEIIAYTNALLCYITDRRSADYLNWLNINTRELFEKNYQYLAVTNHTLLSKHKIAESDTLYNAGKQISEGFENKDFNAVIAANKKLIEFNPKNIAAHNSLGYALQQQKKYEEAIDVFTTAIGFDPYWPYPYNNRGYCKLQLGDIEGAFYDIQSSLEMKSDNAYVWRNMGVHCLMTAHYEQALTYFTDAEKIDPKTELINFYIGQAYLKLGDDENAKIYLEKSKRLDEHNDSIIE